MNARSANVKQHRVRRETMDDLHRLRNSLCQFDVMVMLLLLRSDACVAKAKCIESADGSV